MSHGNDYTVEQDTDLNIVLSYHNYDLGPRQEPLDSCRAVASPCSDRAEGLDFLVPHLGAPADHSGTWDLALALPNEHQNPVPPYYHQGDTKEFFWRPTDSATSSFQAESGESNTEDRAMTVGQSQSPVTSSYTNGLPSPDYDLRGSPSDTSQEPTEARASRKTRRKVSRSRRGCMTCRQKKKKCDENWELRFDKKSGVSARKCTVMLRLPCRFIRRPANIFLGDRCHGSKDACFLPDNDQEWRSGAARQENLGLSRTFGGLSLLTCPDQKKGAKFGILRSTGRKPATATPSTHVLGSTLLFLKSKLLLTWLDRMNGAKLRRLPSTGGKSTGLSSHSQGSNSCLPGLEAADVEEGLIDFFWDKTSRVMSMRGPDSNPFSVVLLPMAIRHEGLMHTILWMAAYHKSWEYPSTRLSAQMLTHAEAAKTSMLAITSKAKSGEALSDCEFAVLIVYFRKLILSERVEKENHKGLLDSIASILPGHRFDNVGFKDFANEFILYHGTLDAITTVSRSTSPAPGEAIEWPAFVIIPESQLEHVYIDGIVKSINEIVRFRNIIRPRWDRQERYAVTAEVVVKAARLSGQLLLQVHEWQSDPSRRISALYAAYAYLFLMRTIRESYPSPSLSGAVNIALDHLEDAMEDEEVIGIALPIAFMIGCAAFQEQTFYGSDEPMVIHGGQRLRVKLAFKQIRKYRKLPDTERAYKVVQKVWEKMDSEKDEDVISSWHWEEIMRQEHIDGPFA